MVRYGLMLLTLTLLPLSSLLSQSGETVTVTSILSPTVVQLDDGRIVQLLGTAPVASELHTPEQGRAHLQALIGNKPVMLISDSTLQDFSTDTLARYLYIDTILINRQMIADEYALPSSLNHSRREEFQSLYTVRTAERKTREAAASVDQSKKASSSSSSESTSVQCSARTKKGARCKRMTTNASGKCWQHE